MKDEAHAGRVRPDVRAPVLCHACGGGSHAPCARFCLDANSVSWQHPLCACVCMHARARVYMCVCVCVCVCVCLPPPAHPIPSCAMFSVVPRVPARLHPRASTRTLAGRTRSATSPFSRCTTPRHAHMTRAREAAARLVHYSQQHAVACSRDSRPAVFATSLPHALC